MKFFQSARQAVNDVQASAEAVGDDLRRLLVAQVVVLALVALVAVIALARTVHV